MTNYLSTSNYHYVIECNNLKEVIVEILNIRRTFVVSSIKMQFPETFGKVSKAMRSLP
jgi:hypothetical protein